jgi:hypothetical protein
VGEAARYTRIVINEENEHVRAEFLVAATANLGHMASTVNKPTQARMGKTGSSTS